MTRIKEIGHAVLHVSDVNASSNWYCDVLGMEVVVESPHFPARFLSFGRKDHDIALFQSADIAAHGGREYNHLAFEIDGSLDDLKGFRRRLVDRGVTITGTVDHGISYGVYFLDPDGHQLEVFQQRTGLDDDPKAVFRGVGIKATPIDLEAIPE
jgi:catechol-2,3-dioxygenase